MSISMDSFSMQAFWKCCCCFLYDCLLFSSRLYICFQTCCNPCLKVFELVRSDALAFVNLSGNPYCNSSRYCEYLCEKSLLMDGSQATSRTYRICAHMLIASIVILISMYLDGSLSFGFAFIILLLSIFISTYFISLHPDIAESILIVFL